MWGGDNFHSRSESTDQNQFMHLPVLSRSLHFARVHGVHCHSWRILPITRRSYPTTKLLVAPTYWHVVKLIPCRIQVLMSLVLLYRCVTSLNYMHAVLLTTSVGKQPELIQVANNFFSFFQNWLASIKTNFFLVLKLIENYFLKLNSEGNLIYKFKS